MDPARAKAVSILREMVGERAEQFEVSIASAQRYVREALGSEFPPRTASEIAFHMTDWNSDAAFIAALILYPERFTSAEIRSGILNFLIHAPNHLAAAAKLHGYPVDDIFEVGALDGPGESNEPEIA